MRYGPPENSGNSSLHLRQPFVRHCLWRVTVICMPHFQAPPSPHMAHPTKGSTFPLLPHCQIQAAAKRVCPLQINLKHSQRAQASRAASSFWVQSSYLLKYKPAIRFRGKVTSSTRLLLSLYMLRKLCNSGLLLHICSREKCYGLLFLPRVLTMLSGKELIESKEEMGRETSREVTLHPK